MAKSFEKVREKFNLWVKNATADKDLSAELKTIENDDEQIYEQFYRDLEFGTGGLRGILGAGSNRMNIYIIRKATQGLANYLNSKYDEASSVAIGFDSRIKSDVFAKEAAQVLAANGITVFLFNELQPTPVISYAIRQLGCKSGIMVTASHNPAVYNGYKCYRPDGCQLTDDDSHKVTEFISKVDIFKDVKTIDFDVAIKAAAIRIIEDSLIEDYLSEVEKQQIHKGICRSVPLSVTYTPLHGAGNKPVRSILGRIGVSDLHVVSSQELPNGNFPTAPYPNPEIKQAFEEAFKVTEKTKSDLIIATDPDCDRMGIAVRQDGKYVLMTGNEVGALLFHYVLSGRVETQTLPKSPLGIKTIVTTNLVNCIAKKYDCELLTLLTGFKYIGEQITLLEEKNQEDRFVFAFEESYGYLAGTYARDKDGVVASMLVAEMAAYYKAKGKTLYEAMQDLYDEFGVFLHTQVNAAFEGSKGMEAMSNLMTNLRKSRPESFAGFKVLSFSDYLTSEKINVETDETKKINLPKSNVLEYVLEKDASLIVRPSGTEPKIKVYISSTGKTRNEALKVEEKLMKVANELLKV